MRSKRAEDTVRFILEAGEQIVAREGMPALTLKRVAEVAGVGVGTVYHHFADRAALLRDLERRAWMTEFDHLIGNVPPIADDTIDAAVRSVVAFVVESVIKRIDTTGVTMDDPDLRSAVFGMLDQTAELMTLAIAPAASRMRRADTESLRLATEMIAVMSWVAAHRHRDRVTSGEFQRDLAEVVARFLLHDRAP